MIDAGGPPDLQLLKEAPYLNAVITETLRLHPPNPAGVIRVTPPEGITVGNQSIPGGTSVRVPFIALHRCTRHPLPLVLRCRSSGRTHSAG